MNSIPDMTGMYLDSNCNCEPPVEYEIISTVRNFKSNKTTGRTGRFVKL